jgi:hypothetical protein
MRHVVRVPVSDTSGNAGVQPRPNPLNAIYSIAEPLRLEVMSEIADAPEFEDRQCNLSRIHPALVSGERRAHLVKR